MQSFERFATVNHWIGAGDYQTQVRVLSPEGKEVAQSAQSSFRIEHEGYADNVTFFANVALERAGRYAIQTFIDGSIMNIYDAPWPGFTPDLMSIVLVVATQARGSVLIHQKMFESRLFFVDKLIDMGAQIILCDPHRATVIGLERKYPLRGIEMSSPDIRAGVALLIAALSAQGKSRIHNINQIDRGYENIDGRLQALGAQIQRLEV